MPMGIGLGLTFTLTNQSVLDFLASLSDGFAFDFAQTDRHFQESVGPTLADDVTDPIGLALENREWNGRTLAQELATQAEFRGGGTLALAGTATAATYDTSTGVGSATRVDFSNQSGVVFSGLSAGKTFALDITAPANLLIRDGGTLLGSTLIATAAGRFIYFVRIGAVSTSFCLTASIAGGTQAFTVHSVKLVPTHHGVQSSSSLRGARAVFNGYSDDQAELVTNGTFDVDASGWTAFFGTTSIVSGKVRITNTDGIAGGRISQPITCVIGKTYAISAERITGTSAPVLAVTLNSSTFGTAILNVSGQATNTLYFVATQTTHYVMLLVGTATIGLYSDFDNISVKEVPASRITTGCKYDGSDDNHLTPYKASSGPNFIVAYVNVPATLSAVQIVAGANEAASANRFFLAFNTSGQLCGGVGSENDTTILSTATDWRGKSAVFGLSFDGTTVRLFADNAIVYEAAQSGTPTTTIPFRIGSNNADGSAGSFFAGTIENVIAGTEYLNLARYLQIRNDLINQ
jgi:hypothetical protein